MSNKTLLYLAVAVVVLGGLYLILANNSVPVADTRDVLDVDTSEVTDFLIDSELGQVHLQRSESGWNIVNPIEFPANTSYVNQVLTRISGMSEEAVVTNNAERHSEFGVDSTAIVLTVIANGDSSTILIGSSATGRAANYARIPGEDPVLIVKGNVRSVLSRPVDNWRDRVIVQPRMDQMARYTTDTIELVRPGDAEFFLTKPDTIYELGTNNEWVKLFSRVPHLSATAFASGEDLKGVNFSKPSNWFEVEDKAGNLIHVNFYEAPDGERVFARRGDETATFIVSRSIYEQIFDKLEESLTKMAKRQAAMEKARTAG